MADQQQHNNYGHSGELRRRRIRSELNLSHRFLDSIPENGHLMNNMNVLIVKKLNLAGNNITVLPDAIAVFENLVELDLSGNGLAYISTRIGELRSLRVLMAKNNNLQDLPKDFGNLKALENLNLSGNSFESFIPQMFELESLKVLFIGANRIDCIPRDIEKLQNLEILYLGGNLITSVPPEMGKLPKLQSLSLSDNKVESLPPTLAQLTNLHSLNLHNNKLTTLPMEILQLWNLRELSLRENPLVVRFVRDLSFNPPSLLELSARTVKTASVKYTVEDIPQHLMRYLDSARRCVNPKCSGVYFGEHIKHVKFVDFCGKYRLPFEQYLCSPHWNDIKWEESASSSGASTSSGSDEEMDGVRQDRLKRVLLG